MRKAFFAAMLLGVVCACGSGMRDDAIPISPAPRLPTPKPITAENFVVEQVLEPEAQPDPSPYAAGTLKYRGEELLWFVVAERKTRTVGVMILSEGRRDFGQLAGAFVPMVIESLRERGQVASYLMFLSAQCDTASLEDLSCAYEKFVRDMVAKLAAMPEFTRVCVEEYVGMGSGGPIPCAS